MLTQDVLLRDPLLDQDVVRGERDVLGAEPHDDLLLELREGGEDLGEDGLGHVLGLEAGVAEAEEDDPVGGVSEEGAVLLEKRGEMKERT